MQPLELVLEKSTNTPATGRCGSRTETLLDADAPERHIVVGHGRYVAVAGRTTGHVRPAGAVDKNDDD